MTVSSGVEFKNFDKAYNEILSQLRRYLPEDIGIESCQEAAPRFHARLNCNTKTYTYRIWNSEKPCVFERRFVYVYPEKLDIEPMKEAAEYLAKIKTITENDLEYETGE